MSAPIGALAGRLSGALSSMNGQGPGLAAGRMFDPFLRGAVGAEAPPSTAIGLVQGGDTGARQVPLSGTGDGASFGDSLKRALNGVSAQQDSAADTLSAFLRGENVELHQVMAATEEAQISLQMLIEVRNKFTEAYRTLSTMQG
ncbi:MAG: flagellar hook-basal body complex protein FliE [Gemmatimonadaceae bacterium]